MKRAFVFGLALPAAFAAAQVSPFNINVNYAWSNSFNLNGGGTGRLSGIEVGVSQSVVKLPFLGEARVGATALFGNLFRGNGVDGSLYRIFAWYKTPMAGPSGVYGLGGFHYATASGRGGTFDTVSGFGVDFGIGIPLSAGVPGVPSPAIEVMYHQGSRAQLRGFSIGVNVRF